MLNDKEFDAIKAKSAYLNLPRRSLEEFDAGVPQGWDEAEQCEVINLAERREK